MLRAAAAAAEVARPSQGSRRGARCPSPTGWTRASDPERKPFPIVAEEFANASDFDEETALQVEAAEGDRIDGRVGVITHLPHKGIGLERETTL